MATNSSDSKSTPEYGRLRNFWQAKSTESLDGNSKPVVKNPVSVSNPSNVSNSVQENHKTRVLPSKTEPESQSPQRISATASNMCDDLPQSVLEFDQDITHSVLAEFLQNAAKVGGEVSEHANMVQKAFKEQRDFLIIATKHAKPSDAEFQKLLGGIAASITEIQQFREKRRSSPHFNHLSGVSEGIPALAWVTISPTPAPYIKEMNDAGQFYTNRVLKDFKDKPGHSEWAKAWVALLSGLQTHVRKHHTTGLVWGKAPLASGGPAVAGGVPPPPPPPAFEMPTLDDLQVSDDRAQLFAEINKGGDVTRGLKKVTADMQTHKNPNLRQGGSVPTKTTGVANGHSAKTPVQKPPKFSLEGKKWSVEYQVGEKNLKIANVEMNQVVYVFGCKDSTLTVSGKLNSIVVDSCVKSAIVFDSLVASVEFVNCRDCQMQVMGTVPTITIDKVDGLQMFLSKDSLNVEIVSAKSSALNVMVPKADGDFAEYPIPEQFKTTVGPKGLVTSATESVGV